MSEDFQKPPVIDLDKLLQPISDEAPAGESLRYSGIYDEITDARRADDTMNQGAWQTEVKYADYRRVIDIAVPALQNQSKDLQVASWLSESLIRQHGFAGLRDSLKLLTGFQDIFWDTMYPEVDEGDMEGRANAIAWMELQGASALKDAPITSSGIGFNGFEDSKRFDIPENLENLDSEAQERWRELKIQSERERRTTGDMWRSGKAQTRRRFYEEANLTLEECWVAYNDLNRSIEEHFERNQMPSMNTLKKALDDVHTQVKKLLEEKRIEEPDEIKDGADSMANGLDASGNAVEGSSGTGSVQGRKDALRRLGEIAAFFQRTEPHSPVAYLVQRAVKWGNMPLESWLQEVIQDENVLGSLRQTLGLDSGGGGGGSWGESTSYTEPTTEEAASNEW